MGEKTAKDFTLEEASALLLKDTNKTDSDVTNYIIRQVDKILASEKVKEEKTVALQFLGKYYDCGEWHITTNTIKTMPESVALRLEKDFPKQWKRVKEETLKVDNNKEEKVGLLRRGLGREATK